MKNIWICCLIFISAQSWSKPSFLIEWDDKGDVKSINGVLYLGQDNDPACSGDIFVDEIKAFNYTSSDGNMEIVTTKSHSPDGLSLYKNDLKDLNFNGSNYLSMFLKTKEKVVFIGEKCGSGGYFNIGSMIKLSEFSKLK
ncbi:hypothetical protein [Acinetobacter gerneri]|uniref:hypothetical protein n=1 Tax=Acinetobacter gerneri TaxID=202952 RepID=UPI0028AE5405|nr:hypothetical protein [Acinetobacter gerneri]